jgi:hypothetical protein
MAEQISVLCRATVSLMVAESSKLHEKYSEDNNYLVNMSSLYSQNLPERNWEVASLLLTRKSAELQAMRKGEGQ